MPEIILFQARVLHSPEDFGQDAASAVTALEKRLGKPEAKKYLESVAEVWQMVKSMAKRLGMYGMPLDIFLDGLDINTLDVPGKVRKLATNGVPMYIMAQELQEAGTIVHGTESHALLMEERTMATTDADPGKALELLEKRDRFIAERITEIMRPEKRGFLIIGRDHNVPKYLSDDFLVKDFG